MAGRGVRQAGWLAAGMVAAALGVAQAGPVEVVAAEVRATAPGIYHFDVTLAHGDTGWDHYADAWEVRAPDGGVLGIRTLYHPHVDEQPFTRSLSGVAVPDGLDTVVIHARDSLHGWTERGLTVQLPR